MIAGSLTSRRTQLELLATACTEHRRARVIRSAPTHDHVLSNTRFVALHEQSLDLEWPVSGVPTDITPGTAIEIHFDVAGESLTLRAHWQGPDGPSTSDNAERVWRIALPLCIERRTQRVAQRISLASLGGVAASLTCVNEPRTSLGVELQNISAGGVGGLAPLPDAARIRPRQLYWARFELPTEPDAFEFVVRLVHAHEVSSQAVVWGGMFCPGEDPANIRDKLQRIERLVQEQARPTSSTRGGEQAC